ncbi:sodium:solute symporter [Dysgonomonas sp. 520]|uniref:sodium:solute symporter n=1 Tax=Dysgonomonas sp. 520 TaxID=2302931 RepID=UPI0013D4FE40|nr:sodium:solute symporter [Dysgonomonas sp. 520]NDW10018.1 sodium:solute symporter [Dysgonomonas sp. 520]
MQGVSILIIMAVYFGILYLISYFVSKKHSDNEAFFLANRKSPWWVVAIAMVGTSISGVTFVSVPGMVGAQAMTYMQMVFGFFFGYLTVAYVLLPLYYKLNLTTIYGYLEQRLGFCSYKTGASFFILSKLIGAAARLYLVALILQTLVFDRWDVPFTVTVVGIIALIWAYTHKSGIKTIIWTDSLQTLCLVGALFLIIWQVASKMSMDFGQVVDTVKSSEYFRIFEFDWGSKQNFFKQFFSGIFITIVMTGLDQDMMQKNLTVKNLKDSQKNMLTYGFAFVPINFLFLCLGILLLVFASSQGIVLPEKSDQILPVLASEYLGLPVLIFFTVGIIAAAFSSADSALTALTTTVCVDLLNVKKEEAGKAKKTRLKVHIGVSIVFAIVILIINAINNTNVLDAIYTVASYTYGPLLGMFCFGLFTKRAILKDKLVPYVCILAPVLSFSIDVLLKQLFNYTVGYEILMFNGLLTFIGLWILSKKSDVKTID